MALCHALVGSVAGHGVRVELNWFRVAGVVAVSLAVTACASSPRLTCGAGEQRGVLTSLYFGTVRPGGVVTADQWRAFVDRVVTPRFPQGLTSWEASGQWRSATGMIEREASYVLHVAHPDTDENELAVREITSTYKTEFQQEAVLRVRANACMSF